MADASTDVCVVGGGPAGLAVALAARQRGMSVIVADAQLPGIDKACGEGLLPDAADGLRGLGVHFDASESRSFRGIQFIGPGGAAAADFPNASRGLGVRRTTLHKALLKRSTEVGAVTVWGEPVLGISGHEVSLRDGRIRARYIVGADGAHSRVRRWAGLDDKTRANFRYAFRQHFAVAPWSDYVEVHWSAAGQIYVTPLGENEVGVVLISRDPKLRLGPALKHFPELARRLAGARALSRERGGVTAMRRLRRIYSENIALVGDASGTVDAVTGEGLGLAFRQAIALADCLQRDSLQSYPAMHSQFARRPRLMGRLLLALDGRPRLQQRTLRVFQQRPQLFEKLLALHVGAPEASLTRGTLAMGWGLLTA